MRWPSWRDTVSGMSSGVLRHEIDADGLGADQPHHLLDFLEQRLGRILEQKIRLVEEEYELRLIGVADLRQFLE